LLLWSWNTI